MLQCKYNEKRGYVLILHNERN